MARKKKSTTARFATNAMVLVLAVVVAVMAYKQVFLVSRLTGRFPDDRLTHGLAACFQEHMTPGLIQSLQPANMSDSMQQMLEKVLQGISGKVAKSEIREHYITEVKVLKIDDLVGKNARLRVSGTVDVAVKLPLVGQVEGKRAYVTEVFKRGSAYYFEALSVKGIEDASWTEWACAKHLSQ